MNILPHITNGISMNQLHPVIRLKLAVIDISIQSPARVHVLIYSDVLLFRSPSGRRFERCLIVNAGHFDLSSALPTKPTAKCIVWFRRY